MDHMFLMDRDFEDDIECCRVVKEEAIPVPNSSAKLEKPFPPKDSAAFDLSVEGGKRENLGSIPKYGDEVCRENVEVMIEIDNKVAGVVAADLVEKKMEKEKRKSVSAKKPPKPPRPPRRLSLDVADQKLMKELAELATVKRAKIERIKALKKMKAAKASSYSSSSSGSIFAMLCTVIFCVVIICQGMSSGNNAAISFHSSLVSAGASHSSFVVVQEPKRLSAIAKNSTLSEPPNLMEHASGLDTEDFGKRSTG